MDTRYYINAETGQPHLFAHGVAEHEVEEVLARPGEDRPGHEGSRVALGRTRAGRFLRVIYVPDRQLGSVFVITAYELKGKALMAFRRRLRRRPT